LRDSWQVECRERRRQAGLSIQLRKCGFGSLQLARALGYCPLSCGPVDHYCGPTFTALIR